MNEVSVKYQESPEEGGLFPAREAHSVNIQHIIIVCLSHPGLKKLTSCGEKDEETDQLDSVISSDDCNLAIRAGSLEEEAFESQTSKV